MYCCICIFIVTRYTTAKTAVSHDSAVSTSGTTAVRSAAPSPANVDFLDHFVAAVARSTTEVCGGQHQQASASTDESSSTAGSPHASDADPQSSAAVSSTTTSSERRMRPLLSSDRGVLSLTLTPESEDLLRSLRVWDFTAGGMLAYPFDLQAIDAYVAVIPMFPCAYRNTYV